MGGVVEWVGGVVGVGGKQEVGYTFQFDCLKCLWVQELLVINLDKPGGLRDVSLTQGWISDLYGTAQFKLYIRVQVHACACTFNTTEISHLANCTFLAQLRINHTHTLSMHCCNTRLSCLVCFSRTDFAYHVKSWLRQWDPWRALRRWEVRYSSI